MASYQIYSSHNYTLYLYELYIEMLIIKMELIMEQYKDKYKKINTSIEQYNLIYNILCYYENLCMISNCTRYDDKMEIFLNLCVSDKLNYNTYIVYPTDYDFNKIKQINLKYNIILTMTDKKFMDKLVNVTYKYINKLNYLCVGEYYFFHMYDKMMSIIHKNKYKNIFDIFELLNSFYKNSKNNYNIYCLLIPSHHSLLSEMYKLLIHYIIMLYFNNTIPQKFSRYKFDAIGIKKKCISCFEIQQFLPNLEKDDKIGLNYIADKKYFLNYYYNVHIFREMYTSD